MNAARYHSRSTTDALSDLLSRIGEDSTDVRLFVTHADASKGGFDPGTSGPDVNLPLVAALTSDGRRSIVHDGNLLNAARGPRIAEVRELVESAIANGSVLYGTRPVDFTAGMSAVDAARYLSEVEVRHLTDATRSDFTALLGKPSGL